MKSCTCDAYPPRPSLVTVHTRSNMSTVSQMQPRSLPSSGGARGLTMDRGAGGTLKLLGTNTQAEPSLEGQCTCRRKWPKTEFFAYYGWSGRCLGSSRRSMGTLRGTYTRSWAFCGTLGSLVPTHAIQLGPSNQRIPPRSHPNRLSGGLLFFFWTLRTGLGSNGFSYLSSLPSAASSPPFLLSPLHPSNIFAPHKIVRGSTSGVPHQRLPPSTLELHAATLST